ncbi:cadmium-translocating P-type ATPase [Alsobacter soli]|uniref:P-type Zn(2+) transporter n=1 Tax=Alsobacter soli TaxID=2109933 RepID=A0A2T1HPW4_9HYPH|nr:cation-translocating P-type ATPase [Alsobacter soli]PSC03549.1 cadmium-translocating P-type ATPase [Alsobacter soli]
MPRDLAETACPKHQHDAGVHEHGSFEPMAVARIVAAAAGAGVVWFWPGRTADALAVAALLFAGWPILREAVSNLLARRMTMELSMAIAVVAAAAIGEFFTALVVALFVLAAEELEHLTVARGRVAIHDLVAFIPPQATVRREGELIQVAVAEIRPGECVVVAPGGKIPVDGVVVAGHSYADQSRITGESMPAEKSAGSSVFAGSINQMGMLEIQVERVGRDTSYGRIIEAVEAAEQSRAPVQRLADQLAGYLVYFALAAAALTWLITRDLRDTISVVIVAGACGIAAGTPLAILGGIGRAAKLGSIIKGGVHLETLGRVDTVILDKTGTLTLGRPVVQELRPAAGVSAGELLAAAGSAEIHSEHPLARAVVEEARRTKAALAEPASFSYTVGRGVTALVDGATVLVGNRKLLADAGVDVPARETGLPGSDIVVAREGRFLGEIIVADVVRPEARGAMAALQAMGVRTLLLTGDTAEVAGRVAADLGIAEVGADMLPEDKLARVEALVASGHRVAMVGDGVNDAPALTAASLGVAMGSGADVTKESADVVLIGNDLGKLVETIRIARRTRAIIWQNFAGTLAVDAVGIVLAAVGLLNPMLAAFIHVGSEIAFLLNSARLLPAAERFRPERNASIQRATPKEA